MDLLEGIEDVNWSQWEHAYGPATDFPKLARNLLDPKKAEVAADELYSNIIHQGTVYPATQHAIPWLVKLLAPDSTADRPWVLNYLLDLAWGNSYMRQHAQYDDDGSAQYAAKMAEEVRYVDAARDAVVAGYPVFVKLLEERDLEVKTAAIDLLVGVPELLSKLRRDDWDTYKMLLENPIVAVRAKAVMGLGWIPDWEFVESLLNRAFDDESKSVRWAASWAMGFHKQYSAECVRLLAQVMEAPEDVDAQLSGALTSSAAQLSMQPLMNAPVDFHPAILDSMDARLSRAKGIEATEAARLMLILVFGRTLAPPRSEMSPEQLRVLKSVAETDQAWVFDGNMSSYLMSWELPSPRFRLREFLESPQ